MVTPSQCRCNLSNELLSRREAADAIHVREREPRPGLRRDRAAPCHRTRGPVDLTPGPGGMGGGGRPGGFAARRRRGQDDIDVLNAAAAGVPVTAVLTPAGVQRAGTAEAVVATIARAAVILLGGPDAARIRQCGDPPCTRLFVDTSRARSRRWCDMAGCGNRAKVAGFRARHSADHAARTRNWPGRT